MKTKLIIYNYSHFLDETVLIAYLKSFPKWAKPFDKTWIVSTFSDDTKSIRDELKSILGPRAQILVIDVSNTEWSTFNVSKQVTIWMKENI